MKKKSLILLLVLFACVLPSCDKKMDNSTSYSYVDPNDINNNKVYNIQLIENQNIEVSLDKTTVNSGEYINLEITNVEPGFAFTGWYINGVYRGENKKISIQIFEDTKIEIMSEKKDKTHRICFNAAGQIISYYYVDSVISQEIFDSANQMTTYLPYGYSIVGWKDKNGKVYNDGDTVTSDVNLYPIYNIIARVKSLKYKLEVEGGSVINADTNEEVNNMELTMGTVLTFEAFDENGKLDYSKVWVDENGEVYSYNPKFSMTLVKDLKLKTIDKSLVDTSIPIIQSSPLFIEHYMYDTPFEYVDLRLYVRIIIPRDFEYYADIKDYGAKMERIDTNGNRQRATFPLNKSQWSVNGEAWCVAKSQSKDYTYKGSGFIALNDIEEGFICNDKLYVESDNTIYNLSGWKNKFDIII